jgi:ubiquitin carboxyl-terminal hydrolase 7
LYLTARVITEDTYKAYGGTDLTVFDVKHDVDPSAARAYRILKKTTVQDLATQIANDIGRDSKRVRLWCMVNRQNKTVRPDAPISDPNLTVEDIHSKMSSSKNTDLRLWAEYAEELTTEGEPFWPNNINQNGMTQAAMIVVFLKHFDADKQGLSGAGHIYISRDKKVEDLIPLITQKMDWPETLPNGEKLQLKLYEVSHDFLLLGKF